MNTNLVITGGRLVDGTTDKYLDIGIADGQIVELAKPGELALQGQVIDADGAYVMPGLVDIQVHFRTPGGEESEDIQSGARGAALGGVTACVMMPNTVPTIDNVSIVEDIRALSLSVPCDLHSSAAITINREGERLVNFRALYGAGVRVFTDDGWVVDSEALMRQAFLGIRDLPDAVLSQHAEESQMVEGGLINEGVVSRRLGLKGRPREAEAIIVKRDIDLARETDGRYHVLHMSTLMALEHVVAAKLEGLRVTAEVTPQHLILTEDDVERLGTSGKMNPPLRLLEDVEALRAGLICGDVDAVATDHAPHHPELKGTSLVTAAPGMLGVETMASVIWSEFVETGLMSPTDFVKRLSINPAKIAGIKDHGNQIKVGSIANLAVFDPTQSWTVRGVNLVSKSRNTPWEGRSFAGRVRHTVLAGRPVVIDSSLVS
jgi:dihydroorotase